MGTAVIVGDYRYRLTRDLIEFSSLYVGDKSRRLVVIMLNPSTADAKKNDATIRRLISLGRKLGFNLLDVVNCFAYRSKSPATLRKVADPVGPDNDQTICEAIQMADEVLAAWGRHATYRNRNQEVIALLERFKTKVKCLGLTKDGHPIHPLARVRQDGLKDFHYQRVISVEAV